MNFQPQTLEKLRTILREDFNQEVSDAELFNIAFNLTNFYDKLMECYYEDSIANQQQSHEK